MGEPFAAAEFVIDYALYLKFHKFQLQKGASKEATEKVPIGRTSL